MLKWMKQYTIEKTSYLPSDTLTMLCLIENGKIMLGYGDHHRPYYKIWIQLDKQFELLEKYFGIRNYSTYSNRYRYWKPYLPINDLELFKKFADIDIEGNFATITIRNAKQFIQVCNKLLIEYLYWCADHRKHCENGLILPTEFYGRHGIDWELRTDRQKEIDRKKHEIAYQKHVEEENKKNAAIQQQLVAIYHAGNLDITCSFRYIYDDTSWYSCSVDVNNLYHGNWQLHYGNNLYTSFTEKMPAIFTQEIFEVVLLTFYKQWQQNRKPNDYFHDNGILKLMEHSRTNPITVKISDNQILFETPSQL